MASLNTSEFQFALIFFAKFNELKKYKFQHVLVPNQKQEGNESYPERGTDLVLDEYFLQFKMSEYVLSNRAKQADLLKDPYLRFKVYNKSKSNKTGQLDFLKIHSLDPRKQVFYVAPCFDFNNYTLEQEPKSFWSNCFYRSAAKDLWSFACFIDIKSIDKSWIAQTNKHRICYKWNDNYAYYFSEPKMINKIIPTIESDPEVLKRINPIGIEKVIQLRIMEIKDFAGNNFFEENGLNDSKLSLFELQQIYFTFFNIFWLPRIISLGEMHKIKIEIVNNFSNNE
jgi:hypothetical protein